MKTGIVLFPIKGLFNLLAACLLSLGTHAQDSLDYQKIFPGKYEEALQFLEKDKWIFDSLINNGIDADQAVAVVFPEILRYSAISNWAETKSLEVLYSQYGKDYADFSIGRFQMKPSFAENIEKDWNGLFTLEQHRRFGIETFDTVDNQPNRYRRVKRLNELHWDYRYLMMFILIMEKKYHAMKWTSPDEKIRFYATAYNAGYQKSAEDLLRAQLRKDFHTSILKPEVCYNYADIALYYYNRIRIK